jgi:hypothetical protein
MPIEKQNRILRSPDKDPIATENIGNPFNKTMLYRSIRANSGMIRDAWWEEDISNKGHWILVLRQIKPDENGAAAVKTLRYTSSEVDTILGLIKEGSTLC